jgi:hypothetical protein
MPMNVEIQKLYAITVMPESDSAVESFEIRAEARWTRANNGVHETGFMIVESPKGKPFHRYVDYLAWRANN